MVVRTTTLAGLDAPELKDATFVGRVFPPHFHDTLSIGIVRAGRERLAIGGVAVEAGPGLTAIIPPHVVHDHRAVDAAPWRYQAMYVSPDLVAHRARRLGRPRARLTAGLVDDAALAGELRALHAGVADPARHVVAVIDHLLRRHASARPDVPLAATAAADMDDAAAVLRVQLDRKLGVAALAHRFGLGPYQLVRAFRKRHGLTPSAYLMVARINEARRLLVCEARVVDVAVAVGFYDQSHFVRYFTRYTGLSPDRYRRAARRA